MWKPGQSGNPSGRPRGSGGTRQTWSATRWSKFARTHRADAETALAEGIRQGKAWAHKLYWQHVLPLKLAELSQIGLTPSMLNVNFVAKDQLHADLHKR